MSFPDFLTSLLAEGRVTVPQVAPLSEQELAAGDAVLARHEGLVRLEMPGTAPRFLPSAARWAAARMFRACQFLVYRDIDQQAIEAAFQDGWSEPTTAECHYSIDLVFRFLPDVAKQTKAAAECDPLLQHLQAWGSQWPLSSVGMPDLDDVDISGFASHASLMQLYVDRIINKHDTSRLTDPRARDWVRRALGLHPDLADDISQALQTFDNAHAADSVSSTLNTETKTRNEQDHE